MVGLGHCHLLYRITCAILIYNCIEWVPTAQSMYIFSSLQCKYNQININHQIMVFVTKNMIWWLIYLPVSHCMTNNFVTKKSLFHLCVGQCVICYYLCHNEDVKSVEHNVAPVVHLLVESERFSCHVLASLKPALNGLRLTEQPAVWQSGHTAPFWSGSSLWQDTGSVKHGWQQLPVCGRRVTLGEVLFWGGHSVSACGGD